MREKIIGYFVEFSLQKGIVIIILLTGISTSAIAALVRRFFMYTFEISSLQIVIVLCIMVFLSFLSLYVYKRSNFKKKYQEGEKVVLSTERVPIMSVGKYNFLTNKVFCSWSAGNIIHDKCYQLFKILYMAIYGIGAKYGNSDVSKDFIKDNIVATGWNVDEAPDLHEYFRVLEPGDIVYIKSCSYSSNIQIKGIGIITDDRVLTTTDGHDLIEIGRNVKWISSKWFMIKRPDDQKNNVRANTIYREFHPEIIDQIMNIVNRFLYNN